MSDPARVDDARSILTLLGSGDVGPGQSERSMVVPISGGAAVLTDALRRLDAAGIAVDDVGLRRPTLDDAFLSLTGHAAERRSPRPKGHRRAPDGTAVAKRNLIKIKRVPELLVFTTASPIMFVLLFAYVFGGAIGGAGEGGRQYREFLIAGIFAQTVVFGATITGAGLAEDVQKGIIDRFRSSPMSPSAVLTGRTQAGPCRPWPTTSSSCS